MSDNVEPKKEADNPTRVDQVKKEATKILKDDIVGVSDWKNSKLGFLSGWSPLRRSVSSIGQNMSESSARLNGLMQSLTYVEPVAQLEDGGTPDERFVASMQLHGKSEKDLPIILRNTLWSAWLYFILSLAYLVFASISISHAPSIDLVTIMMSLGPLALLLALLFKHSYTNWIVRHRRLGSALEFLKSFDYLPRM
jgi:hypothetical protein